MTITFKMIVQTPKWLQRLICFSATLVSPRGASSRLPSPCPLVPTHAKSMQRGTSSHPGLWTAIATWTRSAACGDTNTFIPFATQQKASSLRAAVDDYRRGSDGRASVDYAFHLVVSDPTPHVLQHEYGP
jgi:hypothetical protein